MGMKADFIDALRKTPDGVKNFLDVAIPSLVATTDPTSKDNQNILAHNLNAILMLFVGFTPVETVMRVGQHSNPLEVITLAVLEYIQTSNAQQDFTIDVPAADDVYQPGDIRVIVSSKGSNIQSVTGTLTDSNQEGTEVTFQPSTDGSVYWGLGHCITIGGYILNVSVTFDDKGKTVKTASRSFNINTTAADPSAKTPEPIDRAAVDSAVDNYNKAAERALAQGDYASAQAAYAQANAVYQQGVNAGVDDSILTALKNAANDLWTDVQDLLTPESP
jgi:hypothetical protein